MWYREYNFVVSKGIGERIERQNLTKKFAVAFYDMYENGCKIGSYMDFIVLSDNDEWRKIPERSR